MNLAINDPAVEEVAREMLRETIERSGWYPNLRTKDREERIERDVEQMWRMMAQAAREWLNATLEQRVIEQCETRLVLGADLCR